MLWLRRRFKELRSALGAQQVTVLIVKGRNVHVELHAEKAPVSGFVAQ